MTAACFLVQGGFFMTKLFSEKVFRWLLPVVLILFVMEAAILPLVVHFTYSDRSETPNHILTYTPGATGIDSNGVAVLDLFDYFYGSGTDPDVLSSGKKNVVAPGTGGFNIVRLKNSAAGNINYTAVLYRIRSDEQLLVEASLTGTEFTDTDRYFLPAGVSDGQVIRAVSGTVAGGAIQDFDLSWFWQFYVSDAQDAVDTSLGSKLNPDEVTVGLYIVVEDNNSYITPDIPQTGDESGIVRYSMLMLVSFLMLIFLLVERRRELQQEALSREENS